MRRDLEEQAQVWHEAAELVRKLKPAPYSNRHGEFVRDYGDPLPNGLPPGCQYDAEAAEEAMWQESFQPPEVTALVRAVALREEADRLMAYCPAHGSREPGLGACPCTTAAGMRNRAATLEGEAR